MTNDHLQDKLNEYFASDEETTSCIRLSKIQQHYVSKLIYKYTDNTNNNLTIKKLNNLNGINNVNLFIFLCRNEIQCETFQLNLHTSIDEIQERLSMLKEYIKDLPRVRTQNKNGRSYKLMRLQNRLFSSTKCLSSYYQDEYITLKRLLQIKKRVRWYERNKPSERFYTIFYGIKQ